MPIPYYRGEYARSPISKATQQGWLEQAAQIELRLPSSNEWQPENQALVEKTDTEKAVQLVNKPGHSVWFQQSKYLNEPKANLKLQLNSDLADQSAKARVTMSLLLNMLNKQFAELNFVTQEAGLNFSLSNANGLLINIAGYSDKQDRLLLRILSDIKNMHFTEQSLALAKQELQRRLHNKSKIKAMDLALDGFRQIVCQPAWSDAALLAEIEGIAREDIEKFVKQLFEKSALRLLALGNLSREQVLAVSRSVEKIVAVQRRPFYNISRLSADLNQGALNYPLASQMQDDALAASI